MAKANPKAWFPNEWIARINHRAVDKQALSWKGTRPFFNTWNEAHAWMMAIADKRLKKAQAELKSATRFHDKVKAMQAPAAPDDEMESINERT